MQWTAQPPRWPASHECTEDCRSGLPHDAAGCRVTSIVSAGEPALVAILRGVTPEKIVAIADALYDAGIRKIEVPLTSPEPFASIARLAVLQRIDWLVGAGTVLNVDDVRRTH